MTTTIKCRIYPTRQQERQLEQTLDGCRWVYNYFRKKQLSLDDMQFALVELKESHSWLRSYHSKMLQMVVHQIDAQFLKSMSRPLRRADRRVSRRQYGSNNYNKAKHMRARLYERMYNKRHDFLHKWSSIYAKRYDLIFIERLQLQNMVKNHHLARAILDSGFGYFKQMLWYKAKIVVDTSIECSGCHEKVPKSLAVRTHRCPYCDLVLDRDHNSALVIEQRGRAMLCLPAKSRPTAGTAGSHACGASIGVIGSRKRLSYCSIVRPHT